MSNALTKFIATTTIAFLTAAMPALADCQTDVSDAFAKQRETNAYRMKTRQISARGVVFMTVDYLLPFKMHQTVKAAMGAQETELILIGTKSWYSSGLGWSLMSKDDTKSLNKQFGASVLKPPKDTMKYECLGRLEVDGKTMIAYQGRQGSTANTRTDTAVLRTVYIDPDTGLPYRATVARASKPDLAFFKADYSYPKDISIEPPKDVKPNPAADNSKKESPNQSPAPKQ